MLEITNFVLELFNKTFNIMKKERIMAAFAVLVTATILVWLLNSERVENVRSILMIGIPVVILIFAILVVVKRWKAAKNKLPAEDELSKRIQQRGAATSFYVSLYLWLALMFFEENIDLERSTLIGAGIVGMAIIYALSWLFHRYLTPSHD